MSASFTPVQSCGAKKGSRPWNYGLSKGWTDKRGYRWIYVTENGKRRARREHRAVMEAHLGRKLEPWELVHHRDGDKLNNDLANLEIKEFGAHTAEHHLGARRDEDACRSIEAFARMREALKEERAIKAELYEALVEARDSVNADVEEAHNEDGKYSSFEQVFVDRLAMIDAALAKARGETL